MEDMVIIDLTETFALIHDPLALAMLIVLKHKYGSCSGAFSIMPSELGRIFKEEEVRPTLWKIVKCGMLRMVHRGGGGPGDYHQYIWSHFYEEGDDD